LTGVKLNTWQLHDISLNSGIAFLDNDWHRVVNTKAIELKLLHASDNIKENIIENA
jgi:hypothetical protein